jgi:1-acyl-sn-glycerol-3-phosphate acyltransferase
MNVFYKIIRAIITALMFIFYRIKITGRENVPKEGPLIMTGNHTHSFDALPMLFLISKRKVRLISKKELFKNKIIGWFFRIMGAFPVDRSNPRDIEAYRTASVVLKEKGVLGIFFQGTRNQDPDMKEAKNGVALFALKERAPILPFALVGTYKLFTSLTITIGEPIYLDEYYGQKIKTELLNTVVKQITQKVAALRDGERYP